MRNRMNYITIICCLLQLACDEQREPVQRSNIKPPKIVEAKTYKIPLEETVPPQIIPVSGVKKILAGKPETVYLKSNVFPAKATRVVPAGSPKLLLPPGESFKDARVVPAIDSPFIAGPPEIILVKDLFRKQNNPETFSSITAMHGLNSNEISSLCQDKAGNLWIGAWWGGVSKYDGKFLTSYSVAQGLSSDVVNCVFEDNDGNIWIGTTGGGVNKFDGTYITRYSTKEGLASDNVWTILQDKRGDMWFATFNGITRYDGSSFTHYNSDQGVADKHVMRMFEDSKGNLWAGSHGGLTRFDGDSFQNYTTALGVNDTTQVRGIVEDNDENIWFATSDKGLLKYDGQSITHFTREGGGLSSDSLTTIKVDLVGDNWIVTFHHGVIRYDGKSFTRFGDDQGLGNEVVEDILQDKRGNIWVATIAGVSKYD